MTRRFSSAAAGRTTGYAFRSLAVIAAAGLLLGLAFGGPGIAVAGLASIPWLAWRHDNESGTFFVLAVLFLIVLAVPAMLLVLMAVTH